MDDGRYDWTGAARRLERADGPGSVGARCAQPVRSENWREMGRSVHGDRSAVVQLRPRHRAPGAAPAWLVWRVLDGPGWSGRGVEGQGDQCRGCLALALV